MGALPRSWFASDDIPVLRGLLNGLAAPLSWIYQLYAYTLLQMRIGTATGAWIDRISYDFLGNRLPRKKYVDPFTGVQTSAENDDTYRARVKAEIMRPRQTRAAIVQALEDLTGKTPQIFEPWNPGDCGAYGMGMMGYGVAGCYGSLELANQIFVTALRPQGSGVPGVGGYGQGQIAYGQTGEYIDDSQITGPVTDADIYAAVAGVKAGGMTAWVAIQDSLPAVPDTTVVLTADSAALRADTTNVTADKP